MPLPLVLISTPIDLGKIKLGNLVPNISQPHIDAFEPYTLPDDAIHVSEQVDFKTRIEQSKGSALEATLTRLLSGSRNSSRTHVLNLSACKAMCYEVKGPLSFFKEIISQERTRMRLQDAIASGHKIRIGFKWFASKNVDSAFLDVKNRWKVMGEEMMGDEDEDEEDIIEADLEETLDDDDIGEVEIISY
ncbi:hypothetical protein IWW34DRAFT_844339 [Fusarium oxysporum f. sp. albedinis]|nr:hypothetical protein IWW34DRAFT_844339 [Fusarium oxysporum f. sp. albedinis]KAK2478844.1 hypothetical protein H9L39_08218 [Fusarium oxysporum f. sp. albedinis]